jgi:hypothetical protein
MRRIKVILAAVTAMMIMAVLSAPAMALDSPTPCYGFCDDAPTDAPCYGFCGNAAPADPSCYGFCGNSSITPDQAPLDCGWVWDRWEEDWVRVCR